MLTTDLLLELSNFWQAQRSRGSAFRAASTFQDPIRGPRNASPDEYVYPMTSSAPAWEKAVSMPCTIYPTASEAKRERSVNYNVSICPKGAHNYTVLLIPAPGLYLTAGGGELRCELH